MINKVHHKVEKRMIVGLPIYAPDRRLSQISEILLPAQHLIDYAQILQVFANAIEKPLALVRPREIFTFVHKWKTPLHRGRRKDELIFFSPRLSPSAIKRGLAKSIVRR